MKPGQVRGNERSSSDQDISTFWGEERISIRHEPPNLEGREQGCVVHLGFHPEPFLKQKAVETGRVTSTND